VTRATPRRQRRRPEQPTRRPHEVRARHAGIALIEVLIALAVLTIGIAGLARLQMWLWIGTDAARQQSEATRLAQNELDSLRWWTRLTSAGGQFAYGDITARSATELTGLTSNTVYSLERQVADSTEPGFKVVTVRLSWTDREGAARRLALPSVVGAVDPFWQGALVTAPRASDAPTAARGRHPAIPIDAVDLPDGRIAWKLSPASTTVWLFDRSSGQVTQRCGSTAGLANADLVAASLTGCVTVGGLPIWGAVRFALASATPGPAEAANPPSAALALDMRVTLTSSGHPDPGWSCEDDADSAVASGLLPGAVRYFCVVQPAGTPPHWSGRLDVVPTGWTIGGSTADARRVCRYSVDRNGNGRIDNLEHPAAYVDVDGPLGQQNFLVVPLVATCPVDQAVQLGSGEIHLSDVTTVAHQP
jgi:Tfp pilus assembly protein PilV